MTQEMALLQVTNAAHNAMEEKKLTLLVLLDMSKAFDCVHHPTLLAKLQRYGIDNKELIWFQSYLTGRSQQVRVGTKFSTSANMNFGVPQGSILGPLLFLITVNDLPSCIRHCDITMFADDAQLRLSFKPRNALDSYEKFNKTLIL